MSEALDALERIAGTHTVVRVRFERDPVIERIVMSWPAQFRTERAGALGFKADSGTEQIIRTHLRALQR